MAAFVTAFTGITKLGSKLFGGIGPDPRKVPDTQMVEKGQRVLNDLWYKVSGEQLPLFGITAYPNVPYGAAGNPNVNIDEIIMQGNAIIQEVYNAMQRPESRQNTFFTNPGSGVMMLFQKVKNARAQAPVGITAGLLTEPIIGAGAGLAVAGVKGAAIGGALGWWLGRSK